MADLPLDTVAPAELIRPRKARWSPLCDVSLHVLGISNPRCRDYDGDVSHFGSQLRYEDPATVQMLLQQLPRA